MYAKVAVASYLPNDALLAIINHYLWKRIFKLLFMHTESATAVYQSKCPLKYYTGRLLILIHITVAGF